MAPRRPKYFKKTVSFAGEELVLYSLDGAIWSSRKDELSDIQERQENQKVTFNEIKSGVSITTQKKREEKRKAASIGQPRKGSMPKKEKAAEAA